MIFCLAEKNEIFNFHIICYLKSTSQLAHLTFERMLKQFPVLTNFEIRYIASRFHNLDLKNVPILGI